MSPNAWWALQENCGHIYACFCYSQHQKCYRQKLFWCYSSYPSPNQRLCILLCFHHPILAILICPIVTILIILFIRSSLFASCHFAAQQHNPTSCKTLKLKINFIRAVRPCLSLHCFILCFTVYWRPLLAFSGLQCRKLPARQDLHLLMNVDCE